MNREINVRLEETDKITHIGRALYSEERVEIFKMLREHTMSVNEIALARNLPISSAALHVRELEAADLIYVEYLPGIRGSKKMCSVKWDTIHAFITRPDEVENGIHTEVLEIPVGSYFDFKVMRTCGLVSDQGYIGADDTPGTFLLPGRMTAQLIWTGGGYFEYRIPLNIDKNAEIKSIEISAEMCSEAPNSREDWQSDITLWVNGQETATYTSPSDFGERRGILNPAWWSDLLTQHGELVNYTVDSEGTQINGKYVSGTTIDRLNLGSKPSFTFRLGVKDDAENAGGLNLFGEKFGDYSQGIIVRVKYVVRGDGC